MSASGYSDLQAIHDLAAAIEEIVGKILDLAPEVPDQLATIKSRMDLAYDRLCDAYETIDY